MLSGEMQFARPLLQLPIRFDPDSLEGEVAALPASAWVPHPQGFEGNDAVPLVSVGGGLNDDFAGPMGATENLRRLPYVMALMEEIGAVWGRSRLMGLAPGGTVPIHVDIHYYWQTHIRIHVPVITNSGVRFICGGEEVHMRPGEAWVFDSFRMHEVRNEGSEKRVHLVLDTVGGGRLWDLITMANAGAPIPSDAWHPACPGDPAALRFETVNQPGVMSPWEIRSHIRFIFDHLPGKPGDELRAEIEKFIFDWQASWTENGSSETGRSAYRELIRSAREKVIQLGAPDVLLDNDAPLMRALDALVFSRALAPPGPAAASSRAA